MFHHFKTPCMPILLSALLFAGATAKAQVRHPIAATSLCNSGLTPKNVQPAGCTTSTPVTPVNGIEGGPSTDGNWELATPYPSAPESAPNPCLLQTSYGPAWVDTPIGNWFNPNPQVSQWISPFDEKYSALGWYIYRTGFLVPTAYPGYSHYLFEVGGQFSADDVAMAVYLQDDDGLLSTCREVAAFPNSAQYMTATSLHFATPVIPATHGYLYFVVQNQGTMTNASGLRVEFMNPYFYPY